MNKTKKNKQKVFFYLYMTQFERLLFFIHLTDWPQFKISQLDIQIKFVIASHSKIALFLLLNIFFFLFNLIIIKVFKIVWVPLKKSQAFLNKYKWVLPCLFYFIISKFFLFFFSSKISIIFISTLHSRWTLYNFFIYWAKKNFKKSLKKNIFVHLFSTFLIVFFQKLTKLFNIYLPVKL